MKDELEKVEKIIVDWLKSGNENATFLSHLICIHFESIINYQLPLDETEKELDFNKIRKTK